MKKKTVRYNVKSFESYETWETWSVEKEDTTLKIAQWFNYTDGRKSHGISQRYGNVFNLTPEGAAALLECLLAVTKKVSCK